MDSLPEFGPESRTVMFAVNGYCMRDRGIDQLIGAVRGYGDGAFHFAWKLPAIDKFACHLCLPSKVRETDWQTDRADGWILRLSQRRDKREIYKAKPATVDYAGEYNH